MSRLFHDLRVSSRGELVATSEDGSRIDIWCLATLERIGSATTNFGGGSGRILPDPASGTLFVGSWEIGLARFDYVSGRQLWHRKHHIGIQEVVDSAGFPDSIFVAREVPDQFQNSWWPYFSGILQIDKQTGKTRKRFFGASQLHAHPTKPILVVSLDSRTTLSILDSKFNQRGVMCLRHFAPIDVAFGPQNIAVAEGPHGVSIWDYDGNCVRRLLPAGNEISCVRVAFNTDQSRLVVSENALACRFLHYDQEGCVVADLRVDARVHGEFFDLGRRCVDGRGFVFDTWNGEKLNEMES